MPLPIRLRQAFAVLDPLDDTSYAVAQEGAVDQPCSTSETDVGRPHVARLFGAFSVAGADGQVVTPTGRKARALLSYMALAGGEAIAREKIAALLWSERGEEQARASLRQTLYELRSLTVQGRSPVASDRAKIWIVAGSLTTDLDEMRRLSQNDDAAGLATWFGTQPKDLLADLDGIDPAFDEWLLPERARRGDERRRTALAVADRAFAGGDVDTAERLAEALLTADPSDEAATRLAMGARSRSGDRDGSRRIFARLEASLRDDIGASPSRETLDVYRRHSAVADAVAPEPATPFWPALSKLDATQPNAGPEQAGRSPVMWLRPRPVWATLCLLLIAVGGALAWSLRPSAGTPQRMLLVEPLGAGAGDSAALALREGLSTDLTRMIVGNDATLAVADLGDRRMARQRDADFIVSGSAQSSAGVLHADLKLLDKDGTILWASGFSRPVAEVDALRQQMASKVADVTLCALGSHNPGLAVLGLETTRLFLGACEQKHGDWQESVKLLKQAVALRPNFSHGWAMLAAATASIADTDDNDDSPGLRRDAKRFADRALTLDQREGEAYYARAAILPGIENWTRRMAILEAGHQVDPNNAVINGTIAWNLALVGRTHEAIAYARQAVAFDPFSPLDAAYLAELVGFAGDVTEANAILKAAQQRFPGNAQLALTDFRLAALVGDTRHAASLLSVLDNTLGYPPDAIEMWRKILSAREQPSIRNRDAAAQAILARSEYQQLVLSNVEKLAVVHRIDKARDLVDLATKNSHVHNDTDRLFRTTTATLRSDPSFMGLAAREKLVPIWLKTEKWPDFCSDKTLAYSCSSVASTDRPHSTVAR